MEMKRHWLLALISANLAALLTLVFIYPDLMVSPGPLVNAHAEQATDCFSCHAPLRGAASDRCMDCHALPDIGLRTSKGAPIAQKTLKTSFHQELIEQDCMACHTDHQGPKLAQRSRKSFSHVLLRPAIREQCVSCHKSPTDGLHRQITGNCKQCHTQEAWKPATFDHDKLFLLDRDHNTSCVTCHTNNDYGRYTCYGCHEHQPDKVRREHVKEGIQNFENCVECHRSADEEPRKTGARDKRERD
jgi:hypothetical protein